MHVGKGISDANGRFAQDNPNITLLHSRCFQSKYLELIGSDIAMNMLKLRESEEDMDRLAEWETT